MTSVPLVQHPKGVVPKLAVKYARRRFGRDVEPVGAASPHSGVLVAGGLLEAAADKGGPKLDRHLMSAAGAIGCSWCIDFGYDEGLQKGLDPAKVRDVPRWRERDAYPDRERAVLEDAEAATATPAAVTDELMDRLHSMLSDAEIVELAAWVALKNYRSRFNAGLGLHSQGFSDSCRVPEAS
jgi:alkylhydroperoxidase family enzyme